MENKCLYQCNNNDENSISCSRCQRWPKVKYFIDNCGINISNFYADKLFYNDPDDQAYDRLMEIKNHVREFVDKGENLSILSNDLSFPQKTVAIKIMLKYFDKIWLYSDYRIRGYYLNISEWLQKMKNYNFLASEEYKNIEAIIKNADLIIWDCLIDFKLSETEIKSLYIFLTSRLNNGKTNIFIGLDMDYTKYLGYLTAQRIGCFETIKIKGNDKCEETEYVEEE